MGFPRQKYWSGLPRPSPICGLEPCTQIEVRARDPRTIMDRTTETLTINMSVGWVEGKVPSKENKQKERGVTGTDAQPLDPTATKAGLEGRWKKDRVVSPALRHGQVPKSTKFLRTPSFPGASLLEIPVSIKNINKGSPSSAGFNRNPAHCIIHRWAVWKASDGDSDRTTHSLVKITPLMLPSSPFHLLFLCPLLMTSFRNSVQNSEPSPCACPMGSPRDHGDLWSHLASSPRPQPEESGPRAVFQCPWLHRPQASWKKAELSLGWGTRRETHQPLNCVFLFLTWDRIQICSLSLWFTARFHWDTHLPLLWWL